MVNFLRSDFHKSKAISEHNILSMYINRTCLEKWPFFKPMSTDSCNSGFSCFYLRIVIHPVFIYINKKFQIHTFHIKIFLALHGYAHIQIYPGINFFSFNITAFEFLTAYWSLCWYIFFMSLYFHPFKPR